MRTTAFKPRLEKLETRDNPSLVAFPAHSDVGPGIEVGTLGNRYLIINGTAKADTVEVRDVGKNVEVTFNGKRSTFSRDRLQSVEFNGHNGNDYFSSYSSVKVIAYGGAGNDTLDGNTGADRLYGGDDNDVLYGRNGHDELYGGAGRDTLHGGAGNDWLQGGSGVDTMNGGSERDTLWADQAGEGLSGGEYVRIEVPTDQPQNDEWSCGPNSVARVLRSYGRSTSYSDVAAVTQFRGNVATKMGMIGPPPGTLANVMRSWKSDTQVVRNSTLETMLGHVAQGKPVIALLRTGTKSLGWAELAAAGVAVGGVGGGAVGAVIGAVNQAANGPIAIPILHYVAVNGFDSTSRTVYYVETDGVQYSESYDSFFSKWNWSSGGIPGEVLRNANVTSRTFLV